MPTKLVNLSIKHIAGVDRPANKRQFLIIKKEKQEPVEKLSVKKEGDKYCVYDGDKKLGSFDSESDARSKIKSMMKGATMLTPEQIAKIADKELQEAIVKQQEEFLELEKSVKAKDEEIATLKSAPPPKDDEEIWKGVPPAIRNRMEAMKKERDEMAETAKREKEERENEHWINKSKEFKYLQVAPEHFGKVLRAINSDHPTEAAEIVRILGVADGLIEKGAIFAEFGKNNTNGSRVADATNVTARVEALAKDYMMLDKDLSESAAIAKVFREHPDWHAPYRREAAIKV